MHCVPLWQVVDLCPRDLHKEETGHQLSSKRFLGGCSRTARTNLRCERWSLRTRWNDAEFAVQSATFREIFSGEIFSEFLTAIALNSNIRGQMLSFGEYRRKNRVSTFSPGIRPELVTGPHSLIYHLVSTGLLSFIYRKYRESIISSFVVRENINSKKNHPSLRTNTNSIWIDCQCPKSSSFVRAISVKLLFIIIKTSIRSHVRWSFIANIFGDFGSYSVFCRDHSVWNQNELD